MKPGPKPRGRTVQQVSVALRKTDREFLERLAKKRKRSVSRVLREVIDAATIQRRIRVLIVDGTVAAMVDLDTGASISPVDFRLWEGADTAGEGRRIGEITLLLGPPLGELA